MSQEGIFPTIVREDFFFFFFYSRIAFTAADKSLFCFSYYFFNTNLNRSIFFFHSLLVFKYYFFDFFLFIFFFTTISKMPKINRIILAKLSNGYVKGNHKLYFMSIFSGECRRGPERFWISTIITKYIFFYFTFCVMIYTTFLFHNIDIITPTNPLIFFKIIIIDSVINWV